MKSKMSLFEYLHTSIFTLSVITQLISLNLQFQQPKIPESPSTPVAVVAKCDRI
ncbi:hypothetical protein [Roseofilum casamattae]|uniref:Uncharacterized protein n=1 Tax=Roseofilum casamattae BLCC-M143 TaxID=3022442 RepID=A0ABT7C2E0_9CYAN|nr:hypothetical protein [Roseofilum casamattae]MDJ1184909.1 hypothetical protein [Roseofilum casamattae BLCC-M143]